MLIADPVRRHWLEHCDGFAVESPAGPPGAVREALPAFETIAVEGGPARLSLTLVPFSVVREVWPLERRLVVSTVPSPLVESGRPVKVARVLAD